MTKKRGFAPPVGHSLPPRFARNDLDDLDNVVATSDLDLHIVRLLALQPDLKVKFRNHDLASLDDVTKQTLLADMNHVLGIAPLQKRKT